MLRGVLEGVKCAQCPLTPLSGFHLFPSLCAHWPHGAEPWTDRTDGQRKRREVAERMICENAREGQGGGVKTSLYFVGRRGTLSMCSRVFERRHGALRIEWPRLRRNAWETSAPRALRLTFATSRALSNASFHSVPTWLGPSVCALNLLPDARLAALRTTLRCLTKRRGPATFHRIEALPWWHAESASEQRGRGHIDEHAPSATGVRVSQARFSSFRPDTGVASASASASALSLPMSPRVLACTTVCQGSEPHRIIAHGACLVARWRACAGRPWRLTCACLSASPPAFCRGWQTASGGGEAGRLPSVLGP